MAVQKLIMPYSDDLLLSLKSTPERFEAEARLLLATKLYELGRVTALWPVSHWGRAGRVGEGCCEYLTES